MSIVFDDSPETPDAATAAQSTPAAATGDGILRNPDRSHPDYPVVRASLEHLEQTTGALSAFLRSNMGLTQRPRQTAKKGASA